MNVWTTLIGRIFKGSARDAVIFGERTPRGKVTRRDGAPARTGAPSGNARAAVSAVCAPSESKECAPAAGCAQGVCLSQTYAAVSRALDARIRALGESMRGLNVAERLAADKSAGYGRYKF